MSIFVFLLQDFQVVQMSSWANERSSLAEFTLAFLTRCYFFHLLRIDIITIFCNRLCVNRFVSAQQLTPSIKLYFCRIMTSLVLRACSHDPGTTHCPGAAHWPRGQLCFGAWPDAWNCSHEFFVATLRGELPVVTRLAEITFLDVNRAKIVLRVLIIKMFRINFSTKSFRKHQK